MAASSPLFRILPMDEGNVETVARLEKQSFSRPWSLEAFIGELSNPMAVYYAAMAEGELAGYAGMRYVLDEGAVTNVAVAPPWRRKGVATALVEALLRFAREKDLATVTLEVRPSNAAAIRLYASLGFERVGLRRHYYTDPVENAVLMTATLTGRQP